MDRISVPLSSVYKLLVCLMGDACTFGPLGWKDLLPVLECCAVVHLLNRKDVALSVNGATSWSNSVPAGPEPGVEEKKYSTAPHFYVYV